MKFEDLTEYDLGLIRSMATDLLINTRLECRYMALTQIVFQYIDLNGFTIVGDPKIKTVSDSLTRGSYDRSSSDVIKDILSKIQVQIDPSKTNTWQRPNPSWYTPAEPKKPWMM